MQLSLGKRVLCNRLSGVEPARERKQFLKVPLSLTSPGFIEGAQLLGHQVQSRKRAIFYTPH